MSNTELITLFSEPPPVFPIAVGSNTIHIVPGLQ
jgi:hypothetical protein